MQQGQAGRQQGTNELRTTTRVWRIAEREEERDEEDEDEEAMKWNKRCDEAHKWAGAPSITHMGRGGKRKEKRRGGRSVNLEENEQLFFVFFFLTLFFATNCCCYKEETSLKEKKRRKWYAKGGFPLSAPPSQLSPPSLSVSLSHLVSALSRRFAKDGPISPLFYYFYLPPIQVCIVSMAATQWMV